MLPRKLAVLLLIVWVAFRYRIPVVNAGLAALQFAAEHSTALEAELRHASEHYDAESEVSEKLDSEQADEVLHGIVLQG